MMQQLLAIVILTATVLIAGATGGRIRDGRRIVGGRYVSIQDHPYQVALLRRMDPDPRKKEELRYTCGGSIVTPNFVLTAAHCIHFGNRTLTHVRYASQDREGGFTDPIKAIHSHPDYIGAEDDHQNDIAILEIEEPIQFSDYVSRVTLSIWEALPGDIAVFTGWGRESENGYPSRYLKSHFTEIQNREKCKLMAERHLTEITAGHVCTDNPDEGTCYGDSGGPLMVGQPSLATGTRKGLLQVGVNSYIFRDCANKYDMDIFTNVAYYKKFIDKITLGKALWGCQFT